MKKQKKQKHEPNVNAALCAAISAIYFDDSSDYANYLWDVIKALGGQEVADAVYEKPEKTYKKFCGDN